MITLFIVQLPTKMFDPVGDYQPLGIEVGIVACYLPPSLVINANVRRFTLYQHRGSSQAVIHHNIGPMPEAIILHSLL
jgi:hypothetical protein